MAVTTQRGRIASLRPTTTSEQQLYVVPAGTEMDAVLRICNQSAGVVTYQVAHCQAGHGDVAITNLANFIFYDKQLAANSTDEVSIHAKATEPVRVKIGTADTISFHLSGNLRVTT